MSQPKKRKNSKAKGASFELVIAKQLTGWWGEEFHRTPASGGLHWHKDNRVAGDIVAPPDSNFPFSVECKKREGWNFEQVIKGTGEVTEWWEQCIRDADATDKIPLLIFSKNRSPIYYMMFDFHWQKLPLSNRCENYFLTTIRMGDETHLVAIGFFEQLLSVPKEFIVEHMDKYK